MDFCQSRSRPRNGRSRRLGWAARPCHNSGGWWWMMIFRSVTQYDSVQCGRKEKLQRLNKPNWTKTSIEKLVSMDFMKQEWNQHLEESGSISIGAPHEARAQAEPPARHSMAQHGTTWHSMAAFVGHRRQDETGWEIGCTQAAHSRNPICGPDHWVVHALEASIVNVIIDDHSWQFLSSVSQVCINGSEQKSPIEPTCCLYLQLRPPSRKKSSLKLTWSVTFHIFSWQMSSRVPEAETKKLQRIEFRITETDHQIELKLLKLMKLMSFFHIFSGSEQSFNTEQFLRISSCAPRRGYMGWLQPLSKIEHDQDISTSRHLDISTSGKIRYEIDMKNHDRFNERFYERHLDTEGFLLRMDVFHVCSPFFPSQSFTIFPIFTCGEVLVQRCSALQFGDVRRLPDTGDCFTWAKATWRPGFESLESLESLHLDPDPFGRRRRSMEWFRGWEPDVSWISMPLSMTWDSQAIVYNLYIYIYNKSINQ